MSSALRGLKGAAKTRMHICVSICLCIFVWARASVVSCWIPCNLARANLLRGLFLFCGRFPYAHPWRWKAEGKWQSRQKIRVSFLALQYVSVMSDCSNARYLVSVICARQVHTRSAGELLSQKAGTSEGMAVIAVT